MRNGVGEFRQTGEVARLGRRKSLWVFTVSTPEYGRGGAKFAAWEAHLGFSHFFGGERAGGTELIARRTSRALTS